jgi:hypothetical protein
VPDDDLPGLARVGGRVSEVLGLIAPAAAERDRGGLQLALGWATIDLDRAEAFWRDRGHGPPEPAPDDPILGARCLLLAGDPVEDRVPGPSSRRILLLEASTEGLLAASLARFGEGFVAAWLRVEPAAPGRAGIVVSRPADGPLGPERAVLGGPRWGPHLLVVERSGAGTIAT